MGKPIFTEQMETDHREETIKSFAENILRLGNECRALADENSRIKAEMEVLTTTPCSRLLRAEREENARLKAEVERLTKELSDEKSANANVENRQQDHLRGLSMENFKLKAKVERLLKVGDAMVKLLNHMDVVMDMNSDHPEIEAWNAAKEGKPSV